MRNPGRILHKTTGQRYSHGCILVADRIKGYESLTHNAPLGSGPGIPWLESLFSTQNRKKQGSCWSRNPLLRIACVTELAQTPPATSTANAFLRNLFPCLSANFKKSQQIVIVDESVIILIANQVRFVPCLMPLFCEKEEVDLIDVAV